MDDHHRLPSPSGSGAVLPARRASADLYAMEHGPRSDEAELGQSFSPQEFLSMLWRRAWLILGIGFLVMAGAILYTLAQTPMYQASATLEVKRQETKVFEGGEVTPAVIADSEHMATQYALLRSRALAERVAETLNLADNPRFAPKDLPRAERLRRATIILERGLTILPVQRSRVIEVRFRSPYPEEAARIATAFAENFIQSDLERRYNATSYARAFLDERLQATKASLEDAERKLVAYSRDQKLLDLGGGQGAQNSVTLDASSLIALNTALTTAQQERITAEQRFIEARDNPATRGTLDSTVIEELTKKRVELSTEYQEKLRAFKPEFPEMKDLSARIEAIDKELQTERGKIVGALEAEMRAAKAKESALQARVNELKGEVQNVQQRSIDYNILSREVDTLRSQYNGLLQRFKEVSITSGVSESQVSIVDRAITPRKPYSPRLLNALLLAGVLALMSGLGAALLVEYIDDTIKSPEDVKTKLGLPLIGVVPKAPPSSSVIEELASVKSAISEAFGSARTALHFSTPTGAPRTLLITGNRPAEGKTSCATGLALAFARIGKRVLVIDADMRRPSFSPGSTRSIGLSGLLTNATSLADQVIIGDVPGVELLPAGVLPPNPAELLASGRFSEILMEAGASYDLVIVDAPPVMDFADAPLLASVCEATVLAVQASGVRRPLVRRTVERLVGANAFLVGVILTKFDLKRSGYGYGYGYHYKYGDAETDGLGTEARQRRRIGIFGAATDAESGS